MQHCIKSYQRQKCGKSDIADMATHALDTVLGIRSPVILDGVEYIAIYMYTLVSKRM